MFERYTEKARRTIFFGRYEASQLGSPYIETEHLLLGLLREDKLLAHRLLGSHAGVESIRKQIETNTTIREKVPTSVDLPLSHESKRVLAYGAEEAERLSHKHIGTAHLLLGMLREEKSVAAQLLSERGVNLDAAREDVQRTETPVTQREAAFIAHLKQWLAEREAQGGVRIVKRESVVIGISRFAVYKDDPLQESRAGGASDPAEKAKQIRRQITFIAENLRNAIANYEHDKAREFSNDERKLEEDLRLLHEQFNFEMPPPEVPRLCVEIVRDDRFIDVQKRCDHYIAEGTAQVWILDPNFKRAYIVTKADGLREFRGEILQIFDPPLEMNVKKIFE